MVPTSISNPAERKITILYIEDDPFHQELIRDILNRRPHITLLCVPQAQAGVEIACTHEPDLILSDINLPDMNGFEALYQLKSCEVTRNIPVIALSANSTPQDIEKGLEAGFDSYITKPISVSKFLETVDSALDSSAKHPH